MLIEGVCAEVIVSGEHLRLFSEHNALGVQTSVCNVTTKSWIAPSESVDDIEEGKETRHRVRKSIPQTGRKRRIASIRVEQGPFDVGPIILFSSEWARHGIPALHGRTIYLTNRLLWNKELFLRFPYHPFSKAWGFSPWPISTLASFFTGKVMERRATRRFRIKLPLTVRWANRSGNWETQAESEDITSRGVYFFLPKEIEKGSSVEVIIVMPQQITLAEPVRVRCQGRVRRTEIKDTHRVGVVVEIEQYRFLREIEKTVARTKRRDKAS